ncbi:MAG TPA: hypothetical protein VHX39_04565 [Acetobacteraceae bacterium]|jgi:hypothetical protein|nr:hypothetical protein [Acetobacteraceae bacterium]HEX4367514.1 hypothetical protein [Rhodopila sp.]
MSEAQITPTMGSAELTGVLGDLLCVAELWKLLGAEDEVEGCVVAWLAAQNDALITRANNIAASLRHKASR